MSPQRKAGPAVPHPTVLLVEDDVAVRRVTVRYLSLLGYSVIEAGNGSDALRLADPAQPIDLLLSDIALPGMRGPALITELRAGRPSLRAVLMTGFATETLRREEWPADTGLLTKPFTLQDLRLCLARQLKPRNQPAPRATSAADQNLPDGRTEDPADGRRPS